MDGKHFNETFGRSVQPEHRTVLYKTDHNRVDPPMKQILFLTRRVLSVKAQFQESDHIVRKKLNVY